MSISDITETYGKTTYDLVSTMGLPKKELQLLARTLLELITLEFDRSIKKELRRDGLYIYGKGKERFRMVCTFSDLHAFREKRLNLWAEKWFYSILISIHLQFLDVNDLINIQQKNAQLGKRIRTSTREVPGIFVELVYKKPLSKGTSNEFLQYLKEDIGRIAEAKGSELNRIILLCLNNL